MSVDISSYLANQSPATNSLATNNSTDSLVAGQANLDSSYQTFLTLLTSQLKNQDPTSPLDTNSFTQQLVQMTGVQQQLLSNKLLQALVSQDGGGVTGAVGLIGKTVTVESPTATMTGGKADWSYNLASNASKATITIADSTGKVVWSGDAPDLSAGDHAFSWDGKTSSGGQAADGSYTLTIKAVNANGATVNTDTSITGVVTSVSQLASGTVINIGAVQAPITSVVAVTSAPASTASNTSTTPSTAS